MTVGLCMIVKNEAHVIDRCLKSVLAAGIDYWVIADTGSTDGTQGRIRELLAGVPGELHEDPWEDFATNRNHVFRRAKGKADWLIWLDADGTLEGTTRAIPESGHDCFAIPLVIVDTQYTMFRIFRGSLDWEFEFPIHEHVKSYPDRKSGYYAQLTDRSYPDGARSKNPRKWLDDAALLETLPRTPRNLFHLAQSYREAENYVRARAAYLEFCEHEGTPDEQVWLSRLYAARCAGAMGMSSVRDELLWAYDIRPKRAEPLLDLARYYNRLGKHGLGFLFAKQASQIPEPRCEMFAVERPCYEWGALEELASAAGMLGLLGVAKRALLEIAARTQDPEVLGRANTNLDAIATAETGGSDAC